MLPSFLNRIAFSTVLFTVTCCPPLLFAQDQDPIEEDAGKQDASDKEGKSQIGSAEDKPTPAKNVDSDNQDASPQINRDRLIYIPFEDLQKVLRTQDGSAVIPYEEYLRLVQAQLRRSKNTSPRAPDAVITSADYDAVTDGDIVRIKVKYKIEVLKTKGWASVPLNFGDMAVGSFASADKNNMVLKGLQHGRYELLINQQGQTAVEFELLTEISTSPENRSFRLTCPSVAISTLQMTVDESDQDLTISPLQVRLPTEAIAGKTTLKAVVGAAEQITVRWNPEAGSQPTMDLLTSVSNQTNVKIEPGLIQRDTELTYEILRGELDEVSILIPLDAQIIDVVSPTGLIRNWKATTVAGKHQLVRVELLSPVRKSVGINIQTEQTTTDATSGRTTIALVGRGKQGMLHGVHADGVVRESGTVVVSTDAALTATVKNSAGVKRVDSGRQKQSWQFTGTTGQLILETRPVEPRILVQQTANVVFDEDELTVNSTLEYTIERAGIFQLALKYPDDLTIRSVKADGMSAFQVDQGDGKINIELNSKRQGQLKVYVTATQEFDSTVESLETTIPSIEPIGVERETGRIQIFAPQYLDVSTNESSLSGLIAAEATEVVQSGSATRVANWTYSQRPTNLQVRTSPRPSLVSAFVATTVDVAPDTVKINSLVSFDVQNAGVDTFRIQVPAAVADQVTLSAAQPGVRIQQRDKSDSEDGWVTWSLTLAAERIGQTVLKADWTVPITGLEEAGAKIDQLFEPIRILAPFDRNSSTSRKVTLTQTRGELRFLRDDALSVEATGQGDTMEAIDIRELERLPKAGYAAFRYFAEPVSAQLTIRRHEIHKVVATVINKAAIEINTDEQRLARYRARYRIQTSERQRLRIDLPVSADLQAPYLDQTRTTLEAATDVQTQDGWKAFYVNISRKEQSNTPFMLTLEFTAPITAKDSFPYEGRGSRQILRLPLIGDDSGHTVTQETRVAIWSPKHVSFVGEPRHWALVGRQNFSLWNPLLSPSAPAAAQQMNQWIGGSTTDQQFATQGNVIVYRTIGRQTYVKITWWNRPFLVAVISIGLIAIGFVLKRTTWENRLTLVVLLGVALAIWAMKDGSETMQFVSAGSLGFVAMVAIWILSSVLNFSAKSPHDTRDENTETTANAGLTLDDDSGGGSSQAAVPPNDESQENTSSEDAVQSDTNDQDQTGDRS